MMSNTLKTFLIGLAIGLSIGWLVNGWRLNGTIETMNATHAKATAKASEDARKNDQIKQDEIDALRAEKEKERKDAQTKINRLNADIAAGRVRLSVAVSGCGAGTDSGTGTGEARAELDAETSQSLVAITADGDDAIRELNMCIDAYEAVRVAVNQPL